MCLTYVDTDLLEQMRDRMYQVLSRIEECAGTLRQMHSQMLGEDLSLSFYPQWERAVDSCGSALQKADRLTETASRMLTVLESAPGEYLELQRQHAQAIERLSTRMSALSSGMAGVMDPAYPMGLQEGEAGSSAMDLERQTMMAVTSLELANLMAVTQVLKDEYAYDQVLPGVNDEREEEDKKKKSSKKTSDPAAEQSTESDQDGQEEK